MACLLCRNDGALICNFFNPPRLLQTCNSEKLPTIIPTVPARMSDKEKCTACTPWVWWRAVCADGDMAFPADFADPPC